MCGRDNGGPGRDDLNNLAWCRSLHTVSVNISTQVNRGRTRENDLRFILYPRSIRFDLHFNSVVPNRWGVFVMRLYSLSLWSFIYFVFYLRDHHSGIFRGQYTGIFVLFFR